MSRNPYKKLLIVVNVDWFFISHRMAIAESAIKEGWDVSVVGRDTGRSQEIIDKGIKFINCPVSRSGTNLLEELKTIIIFCKIYKRINPDIVHHVTLKPVIYGSVVCRLLKIKGTLNAISGLGYNFTGGRKGFVQKMMIHLMKFGFKQDNLAIIFQNKDDYKEIRSLQITNPKNSIHFIKGSGVDLTKYRYFPAEGKDKIQILLPTRMLWDKGVAELRKASEILEDTYKGKIIFILSGLADNNNKAGVSEEFLKDWEKQDYVKWIGYNINMIPVYKNSDIVVLPSYREGMPKSLIEACAIGRPIVTTDAIGCRECVDEEINGYKVPVYSTKELSEAIEKLVNSEKDRLRMGKNSRIKAEKEFSLKEVVNKHLKIYNELYEE